MWQLLSMLCTLHILFKRFILYKHHIEYRRLIDSINFHGLYGLLHNYYATKHPTNFLQHGRHHSNNELRQLCWTISNDIYGWKSRCAYHSVESWKYASYCQLKMHGKEKYSWDVYQMGILGFAGNHAFLHALLLLLWWYQEPVCKGNGLLDDSRGNYLRCRCARCLLTMLLHMSLGWYW